MKIKLAHIISPAFQKSLNKIASHDLPIQALYHMREVVKTLRTAFDNYHEIQRDTAKKYAEKNEHGSPILAKKTEDGAFFYQMSNESLLKFGSDLADLSRVEVDVPEIDVVLLGDLKLNADDLVQLEFLKLPHSQKRKAKKVNGEHQ